jgi:predicted secreted Zn-dependent protease
VTIALQGADAIDDRLDDGFSAETCAQVADDADAWSNQILESFNQESARYDEATGHGSSQGVELE